MDTKEALEVAFNEVINRYNLITSKEWREWNTRDEAEERMLLIAGSILCKLKGANTHPPDQEKTQSRKS
tara:strand:+ start:972 stop:1178 length:207 start_codon:yes stop_codon:yes gene_type:complete